MFKIIPLKLNKKLASVPCLVDKADYQELVKYHWELGLNGYVYRAISKRETGGKRVIILMHRQLLNLVPGDGKFVDHKNLNRIDNRRSNIRVCTKSENQRNVGISSRNTSGIKNVYWKVDRKRWVASVRRNSKVFFLGNFKSLNEAKKAVHRMSRHLDGEFLNLG